MKVSLNHTLPTSLCYCAHKVVKANVKSSEADLLYSSVLLVPIRSELRAQGSRYIAAERTWTYSKHTSYIIWSLSNQSIGASIGTTEKACHVITIHFCDVAVNTETTTSSLVASWTLFTELLPGNALIKSVTASCFCIFIIWNDFRIEHSRSLGFHLEGVSG
jgi:hypothetical protein